MTFFAFGVYSTIYYNLDDLKEANYSDNTASSIMVPVGYTVTLYDDGGFTGSSKIIEGR